MQWFKSSLIFRVFFSTFLPTLLLVLAVFPIYQSSQRVNDANQQVAESYAVIADANQLIQLILDAETGLRGFLLAGDDSFLQPYHLSGPLVPMRLKELAQRHQLTEPQLQLLAQLASDFAAWQQEVAEPQIRQRRAGADLSDVATTGEGKQRVDVLRSLVAGLTEQEQARLKQRQNASLAAADTARTYVMAGVCFSLALAIMLASFTAFYTSSSLTQITRVARSFASGDFKQRANTAGRDEFSILASVFNQLAEQLQQMMQSEQQQRQQLHQQVDKLVRARVEDARQLKQVGELLQSCQTLTEAAEVARISCQTILPDCSGALYLAAEQNFSLAASWGEPLHQNQLEADGCWSVRRGKAHFAASGALGLHCSHLQEQQGASLCIPLLARGDVVGVLSLQPTVAAADAEQWLAQYQESAASLAEQLALALVNIRLRDSLQEQSLRDALTGLYNRRFIESRFASALVRAEQEQQPLSVLMLDIDHFKRLNDQYGHATGDEALRALAALLQQLFRGSDWACRLGGEEFVVLLPGASLAVAQQRAEQLRQHCQQLAVSADGQAVHFTLSIGVAAQSGQVRAVDELLQQADEALYQAKAGGRNQVVVAG